jgi:hypothetical protein
MSFAEIIAEIPNLTEDQKAELRALLEQDLLGHDESDEFLAELDRRVAQADKGGRTYTAEEVCRHFDKIIEQNASRSKR